MILRNGIHSTLRARGRTGLFTALLFVLTLMLTLGLGMWNYCAGTLADMDENYTSIALVEYMGEDYPEENAADENARTAACELEGEDISALTGVTRWETTDRTLASLTGYTRLMGNIPYKNAGIVAVSDLFPMYRTGIVWSSDEALLPESCVLVEVLSGEAGDYQREGTEEPSSLFINVGGNNFRYEEQDGIWTLTRLPASEQIQDGQIITGEEIDYSGVRPVAYQGDTQGKPVCYYHEGKQLYGVSVRELYAYTAYVDKVLQAQDKKVGQRLVLEMGDIGFIPQSNSRYLVHGTFTEETVQPTLILTDFYEGCETLPYQEITGEEDPAFTEGIFADYAAYYQLANNYVVLQASDDIPALECFQQGSIYLEQGRFPRAGEKGVCLVDGWTANQMDLSLGDTVEVGILTSQDENRYSLTKTDDIRTLTIVGITDPVDDTSGFLWVSKAEGNFESPLFGYQLGRAVLDNAKGRQACEALQAMVPDGVQVTLYDQGYSAAAQPLQAIESAAMAVTMACLAGTLVVLVLFAYLFVGRQRETVSVLVSLGTPTGKIRLWMLSGAVVVAGVAALAGAAAGYLILSTTWQTVLAAAQGLYAVDQRYSEAAIGVEKKAPDMGPVTVWPAIAAGLFVFLLALVCCLFFLRQGRKQSAPRRGKVTVRVPRSGTSVAGKGAFRFARLSAKRGGWRSLVVPAASLVLAFLLGLLASGIQSAQQQKDTVKDTAQISGQVTSNNGRQATNLVVSAQNAQLLWESGQLQELSVSLGWHYWFEEENPYADNRVSEDRMDAWIGRQPEVVALNRLSAAPAFYYGGEPQVEWLTGWDESFLQEFDGACVIESQNALREMLGLMPEEEPTVYPCLISETFLSKRDIQLGDTFQVMIRLPSILSAEKNATITLQVVGVYSGSQSPQEIYVPLSFWFDPSWLTGENVPLEEGEQPSYQLYEETDPKDWIARYVYSSTTFTTCRFVLSSAGELDAFRDYLQAQKFSQVGQLNENRITIVLQDQSFVETESGLERYLAFSEVLVPALCAAVGLLGFVISWLMINGRRMEFAMMRGLGVPKGRVFFSFFWEQVMLALLGCLLAGGGLMLMGIYEIGWLAAALFAGCYLIGSALAVWFVGRIDLMALLSERE